MTKDKIGEFEVNLPSRHNEKLGKVMEQANSDTELQTLWDVQNVNAIDRMGYTDHGPVHVQIVANTALKLARLLFESGIEPSLTEDYEGFEREDAEIVVVLAALMHDLGMAIHREDHETYSLFVAQPILDRLLGTVYDERERVILRSEIQNAIISHRSDGKPLTVEAGVLCLGDALDMEKGRSRIPFEEGHIDIYSVSAQAVKNVKIGEGEEKPVHIDVEMTNSAGIFQIDNLLKEKIESSGLEEHIKVTAATPEDEERIVDQLEI